MSPRLCSLPLLLAVLLAGNPHAQSADPQPAPEIPGEEETGAAAQLEEEPTMAPAPAVAGQLSLDDIRTFTAVLSLVKQAYVESVDDHTPHAGCDPRHAGQPGSAQRVS